MMHTDVIHVSTPKHAALTDSLVFTPAVRQNTAVIIALCGGSGSGKTKSALELAVGLAGPDGNKILVCDSEGARALHYADEYTFLHYDWRAPYTPSSLGVVLQEAVRQGIAVVIVDSMSSEHEDEGGLVDMAEAEYQRQKPDSKNSAAAWARPKAQHKQHIVRWLRTARCHVIFCCRASEKVKFEQVERNGRMTTQVVPIGWAPICEKNLLYDVTTSLLFTPDEPGVPKPIKLYEKHKPFFPAGMQVTRDAGRRLGEWCAGGSAPRAGEAKPPISADDELLRDGEDAARYGLGTLEAWWKALTQTQKRALQPDLPRLKELATKAEDMASKIRDQGEPDAAA